MNAPRPWPEMISLFPEIPPERLAILRDSIANERGRSQAIPILCLLDGRIIDGYNRWLCCQGLGQEPRVEYLDLSEQAAFELGVRLNLQRRMLSFEQENALIATLRQPPYSWTQEKVGELLGRTDRAVGLREENISIRSSSIAYTPPDLRYKLPKAAKQEIARQAGEGEPQTRIAARYGISQARVSQLLHDASRPPRDTPEWLRVYDVWNFAACDPRWGQDWPGRVPGQIVANCLHYFTEEGDLVVDPMAGGGVTLDVCATLGRRCLAFDMNPGRAIIQQRDAIQPWPESTQDCSLVFLDPPYWNMKVDDYGASSISALPLQHFYNALEIVMVNAGRRLLPDGHLALLISPSASPEHGFVDHAYELQRLALLNGYRLAWRVSVPQSSQTVNPREVAWTKEQRRMLSLLRDLLILRKA